MIHVLSETIQTHENLKSGSMNTLRGSVGPTQAALHSIVLFRAMMGSLRSSVVQGQMAGLHSSVVQGQMAALHSSVVQGHDGSPAQ